MARPSEDVPRDGFGEAEILGVPREAAGSQTAGDLEEPLNPDDEGKLGVVRGS